MKQVLHTPGWAYTLVIQADFGFFLIKIIFTIYNHGVYLCIWVGCVHVYVGAYGGHLHLELHGSHLTWLLASQLQSSEGTLCTLLSHFSAHNPASTCCKQDFRFPPLILIFTPYLESPFRSTSSFFFPRIVYAIYLHNFPSPSPPTCAHSPNSLSNSRPLIIIL